MGDSGLFRGTLFILCFALVVLLFLPKDCAKQLPAKIAAVRHPSPAQKGLRIESSTPAPSPGGRAVLTWPGGLDAARLQYLIEIDSRFATPKSGIVSKQGGHFDNTSLVLALTSLRYIESQPDGTLALTSDGLLKANATDQGAAWSIPLARRQFDHTDRIECSAPDQCSVTFVWKWQPNDIGTAMNPPMESHSGTARLVGGEGHWVVSDVGVDDAW